MNTIKKTVGSISASKGIKRIAILLFGAFTAALPFMIKSKLYGLSEIVGTLLGMLSWLGLSVLFLTVFDFEKTLKRVLCSLFCFFMMFYVFVYSWFVNLYPLDFVGLGNAESVGVIIIAMTCIPLLHSTVMSFAVFAGYVAAKQTESNCLRAVLVSLGYVVGEYLQSLGTFAFPWARLFVTQTDCPVLLQSASLFGSYFITFIIVLVNAMLALSLLNAGREGGKSKKYALVAVGIFLINALFGVVRVSFTDYSESEHIEALVLQGNIPSGEKWSDGMKTTSDIYVSL
ncbi:MAG: hypothetical protein IJZ20_01950, partial [Clostridia bacterium]|nr:hypothetical protein [Clostridia bacterium]